MVASCSAISPKTVEVKGKTIKTTAYTHNEKDHTKYKKKNAIGTTLKAGKSAASDWAIFPVGTVIKIDNKVYEIDDYGSALINPKEGFPVIDIYQPSIKAMNVYGAKYHNNIEIIKWGSWEESANILKDRLQYRQCKLMYDGIQKHL